MFFAVCLFSISTYSQTADWIKYIKAGGKFRVSMGQNVGTIVKNKIYSVSYNDSTGECTATGFHGGSGTNKTFTYVGGNINNSMFTIWGAAFIFDGAGNVYNATFGLVGTMAKQD